MTQPPDLPGLPAEEESVRHLLADARHDGPTPPAVVARLDATLAELTAERETAPAAPATSTPSSPPSSATRAPVVDLGARRRRMAGIGLLAAAAVVVAGVAIGSGLPSMRGGSDDSSASSADAGSSRELDDSSAGGGAAEDGMSQQPKTQLSPGLVDLPQLSSADSDLDDQLLQLRDAAPGSSAASESARAVACAVPGLGRGRLVAVDADGVPGLVVFRRAAGSTQRVDVFVCGDPSAVRTLTLPAP